MEMLDENSQTYTVKRPSTGKEQNDSNKDMNKYSNETQNRKIFGFHKLVVVLLVLLSVLLLTVVIGLAIKTTELTHQAELGHSKQTKEKYQTLNLTEEEDQLQTILNNLRREKSHLQTQLNILRNNTSQTEARYSILGKENDGKQQLQSLYNNLSKEKDQLQARFNNLTIEKSQLQTQYSTLKNKTSQTEAQRDELQKYFTKHESKMKIKKRAVEVMLYPDTAHTNLIISANEKEVSHGDEQQNVPDNPQRFNPLENVLAQEGFFSGKFYYEVQVKGKTDWGLGLAGESTARKGPIALAPAFGFWTIWLSDGSQYMAKDSVHVLLSLPEKPQKVGVYVDYEAGLISFYDADSWSHLYSYTNAAFTETLYPFFSPCNNYGGKNSSPLIITPVCTG